eukprot:CAMPEP_0195522934 /NCGR_PEP_ID=MMETSP0794_2-20130614/21598_1 /TAXON_ID=515487 /ORGANISM="Stephanopyxis turris, Strain CCMP 815" /LENGTH=116 /DNA_ID=CAMNT_0040652813 /DNA_START=91 /DNA_END=438 /DNA_ORIENTATION=-
MISCSLLFITTIVCIFAVTESHMRGVHDPDLIKPDVIVRKMKTKKDCEKKRTSKKHRALKKDRPNHERSSNTGADIGCATRLFPESIRVARTPFSAAFPTTARPTAWATLLTPIAL